MATTCRSVSEPATPYTRPWLCHTTPLAMPVVSPMTRPGAPLMSAARAEAATVLKVKDADPAERTWNAGSPLTPEGSLPVARRCRPLLEAASARLEAAVLLGDCSTRTEP